MTEQKGPALFLADAPALDFLNAIATPADTPVDWIDTGDGLISWLIQAELLSLEEAKPLRKRTTARELDAVAAEARRLREWFRAFVVKHKGRSLSSSALAELGPLNRLLERDEKYDQIIVRRHDGDAPLMVRTARRWRSPQALLAPIGEALARFVCEEDFADVKACERQGCSLMFIDHTRGRARRWCSMAICGNRAKQSALRQRRKQSARAARD
jgi:predicted RNA-binding Zn ribbon-like protein